ncbi:MAG TPA: hypothetical protein DCM87_01330 [Planctomycetes bacterium]|nr:hypothetical protein [Planctomycetota bacterium]
MSRTVNRGLPCVWLCAALSLPAWAYIDAVTVIPETPVMGSDTLIRVEGGLPDPCWSLRCYTVDVSGTAIAIKAHAEFTGDACMPVIVPYAFVAYVGRLDAGTYTLDVSDQWDSRTVKFDVVRRPSNVPGDANGDGKLDIADAVRILGYLFSQGAPPPCPNLADVNNDTKLDISDAISLLAHLFAHGPPPAAPVRCASAYDCLGLAWPVFCMGHWDCVCGECRMTCEMTSCGDGYCDVDNGETRDNCADCKDSSCRPVCLFIGTRSEGWYDVCGDAADAPTLISYAFCAGCLPECRACGSKGEGWYDTCSGEIIKWTDCDCACE